MTGASGHQERRYLTAGHYPDRMTPLSDTADAAVTTAFVAIPAHLERTPALIASGRFLDCECLMGPIEHPFHVSIRAAGLPT